MRQDKMARSNNDFSRDEFSRLLGVTGEREALEAVKAAAKPKTPVVVPRRHRDQTRQRTYQALLEEQTIRDNIAVTQSTQQEQKQQCSNDPEDDFSEKSFATNARRRRPKAAPVILSSVTKDTNKLVQTNDDEKSTSSEENVKRRVESTSSSDDSDVDNQRQNMLTKRQKQIAEVVTTATTVLAPDCLTHPLIWPSFKSNETPVPDPERPKRVRSSSSSSSSDSSDSGDNSSSSNSDDESDTPAARPVFVPKHKRGLKDLTIAAITATNAKPLDDRRIAESRALVQQAVTTVKKEVQQSAPSIDGVIGAMNDVPDDSDTNLQHLNWVVRQLERMLLSRDLEEERRKDLAEIERRRQMTDEERMAEDAESNASRQKLDRKNQRFFHKGAFYMDKSEWEETDIRLKAEEYAAAVTGDDKRDRSQLPKVMQVKKFGFANQTKWKGLSKEDTTDKRMEMLPLNPTGRPKKK